MSSVIKIIAVCAMIFMGCNAKNVSYVDSSSKDYVSAGLDFHDLEISAKKLVDNFLETYGANADGSEFLEIGDVINDTMQEFDVEQLSNKITRELRNAKKYRITKATSGSGGRANNRLDLHKQARDDEEVDQQDVAEKGSRRLAKISLGGKITERVTRIKKAEKRDYVLTFELVDIQTGEQLWDAEEVIIKVAQ